MTNSQGAGTPLNFRDAIAAIDESIPLKAPFSAKSWTLFPRTQRAEAKIAFLVEYIDHLEGRIRTLEQHPAGAAG